MLLYHTLRQLSTEDADCCRFALPHRRPSGLIFLRHRFTDPTLPRGSILPLRGRGEKRKAKGRAGRRQRGRAPLRVPQRQGQPATPGASPAGRGRRLIPAPPGFSPRGCKGRSPLHEITLIPPSRWEGGRGDRGQKGKQKAGQAGDKKGKPPAAFAIPAPGERTISNAEVPLPRSPPLLGCRHCPP